MMRYGLVGIVLVGALAALTLAAPMPGGGMGMGGPAMGRARGAMMSRMAMMGDIAVANGNVYVVNGGKLIKMDSDLKKVASIDLPRPQMPGGMMGGQNGAVNEEMLGRWIDAMARVDADSDNVYVLLGGKVTKYDTNLKEVKSTDIVPMSQPAPAQ
jgi:hypothetical protein